KRLLNPKRKTIGIRVADDPITCDLLEELGEPLMSTSLILGDNEFAEANPEDIRDQLEKRVDLIIDGGNRGEQPTTVIDLADGDVVIAREGSGSIEPFQGLV